jgi:hypothetical protein
VVVVNMYNDVCQNVSLVWKTKGNSAHCWTNYRHEAPRAGQLAGLRAWSLCKCNGYSNCSVSILQTAIWTAFNSVPICPADIHILFNTVYDTLLKVRYLDGCASSQICSKRLNFLVPYVNDQWPYSLWFGWRRCESVSWQRHATLRPLPLKSHI